MYWFESFIDSVANTIKSKQFLYARVFAFTI